MAAERTRALVGECISRAQVEAARGATLADITAACDTCEYEKAATLVLGRARAGERIAVDTIARVLPGIELPAITLALIAITAVDERARLLELVERRRFPQTKDACELEAIVLYAAWRAGAEVARLIPDVRRLSARPMSVESYALLATIAAAIDDPHVAAATKPIAPFAKEYAKHVAADDKLMSASLDVVIASLPAEIETPRATGFTVRAQKQVGRNDPCPCGSGLKYKKCCADKDDAAVAKPSPVPGLAWDEFLAGDRLTAEHIEALELADLVRVQLPKLADDALAAAFQRLIVAREWTHAERVVSEAVRRGTADELRDELVVHLLECGEVARARDHVAQLPAELAKLFELELAIASGAEAGWHALVAAARGAATDRLAAIDLAYALLRAEPALGIVAARACIGAMHVDDPDLLLELVEDARDRMNVAPEDPAWDVLEALTDKTKAKPATDESKLTEALASSTARIDELERKLAAQRSELEQARTRPAAELMRAPEQRTGLERVAELEALIREGNAERRQLRKQLETATPAAAEEASARREGPRARRVTIEEGDDDVGDDVELGARSVAIPRFERRATDALADVPTAVASETMRTVGTLAAGDGFAWRSVKQAKDMTRPVLMARVGIHHRVLFRVEDGVLDVLDLITREQLLTTLKRLRSGR
ncbi:MAG TPA: SEC-C metal-binding domain-containing protein [Kofleriaceae bacterium]